MTTYVEFNRDLFLCNTLQPADASFSSLLFENTTGNNVITYNNLKNATFYFIPKDNSNIFLNNKFNNLDDFMLFININKNKNNNPPYEISKNVYDFLSLNLNKFTYENFISIILNLNFHFRR